MTSSPRRLCKCCPGGAWEGRGQLPAVPPGAPRPHDLPLTSVHVRPRELREKIQPEILELIKQQRLNRLCEGSSFRKIGNRRRQGERRWEHWAGPHPRTPCGQRSLPGWPLQGAGRPQLSFPLLWAQAFTSTALAHLPGFLVFQNGSGTAD